LSQAIQQGPNLRNEPFALSEDKNTNRAEQGTSEPGRDGTSGFIVNEHAATHLQSNSDGAGLSGIDTPGAIDIRRIDQAKQTSINSIPDG